MKSILIIHLNEADTTATVNFLDQTVEVIRRGCGGDPARAEDLIAAYDGRVDAIGLEGIPFDLQLGGATRSHVLGAKLKDAARITPVVDGGGIRAGLERWGVILADRAQPGIFAQKRILMTPGLNHPGLAQSLGRRGSAIRFADPVIYFALPDFPGVGAKTTLEQAAAPTLEQLKDAPFRRIHPQPGAPGQARASEPFAWADVIAGDIGAIRRYAPDDLKHKTVVVECASEEDVLELKRRQAAILVTMMPSLDGPDGPGGDGYIASAATIEALLVALRQSADAPLNEDTYLDLMAGIQWTPAIRYLQADEAGINKFAFVIHPLKVDFIHKHKAFRWTKYLPDALVEKTAAYMPPLYVSRITGGQSPTTGQKIEG